MIQICFALAIICTQYVKLSRELDKLNCWFAVNKLSLNLSKTNYMFFTKQNVPKNIEVFIHNHKIERVFLTKFLGVFIDCNLNWKEQIIYVKKKSFKKHMHYVQS